MGKKKKFTKQQLAIIRRNYAQKAVQSKSSAKKTERVEAPYPALIVGEQKGIKNEKEIEEYRYRKVMHDDRDGRHLNEKVDPNPDPNDPDPMYIGKRVRHDEKENFEPKPLPWKYPKQ